ncbi:MAG: hypothetical protein U0744_19590 [Gemmataceae bacterium]
MLPEGKSAILEGGPFNGLKVEIVDLAYCLKHHEERGEKCWIRVRKTPPTCEQADELGRVGSGSAWKALRRSANDAALTPCTPRAFANLFHGAAEWRT